MNCWMFVCVLNGLYIISKRFEFPLQKHAFMKTVDLLYVCVCHRQCDVPVPRQKFFIPTCLFCIHFGSPPSEASWCRTEIVYVCLCLNACAWACTCLFAGPPHVHAGLFALCQGLFATEAPLSIHQACSISDCRFPWSTVSFTDTHFPPPQNPCWQRTRSATINLQLLHRWVPLVNMFLLLKQQFCHALSNRRDWLSGRFWW